MRSFVVASLLSLGAPFSAHGAPPTTESTGLLSRAAAPAAATVDAFHAALHRGDTHAAAALLAEDAVIFESGGVERTKREYAAHHLPADAEFSQSVSSAITRRAGYSDGTVAWIASEGRTTGTYKGEPLALATTETMILRRFGEDWKIAHIHWSSAAGH